MKQFTVLCFLALFAASTAQAQHHHYSIAISKPTAVPAYTAASRGTSSILLFNVPYLDSLVSADTIYDFRQSYPQASSAFLRDIYQLETDDSTLPYLMQHWDSATFYYVHEETGTQLLSTYPNDYYGATIPMGCDTPRHLEFIHAPDAWDYTHGDTNVIIGITDQSFMPHHPDMMDAHGSKIQKVIYDTGTCARLRDHGIRTAGLIAGATDNGRGLPAIGWNCRLEVDTNEFYMQPLYRISQDSVPIINASWFIPSGYSILDEAVANEIYELGTSLVVASGNGYEKRGLLGDVGGYLYPAAYNNVISVSGIGHVTNPGSLYPVPDNIALFNTPYSIKYQHIWQFTGDTAYDATYNTSTHNDRVDICAPAYGVQALQWPKDSYYNPRGSDCAGDRGTSYAAPLVAGTMGLMQSINKKLSPYQREVILKTTAKFIDTIGANRLFAGQLGAGALQADQAVKMVHDSFNVNDLATQTMYIAGVDYNHLCLAPALSLYPKFSLKVVNGNGHYRYEWSKFPDNKCRLDDTLSATPSVVSAAVADTPLVHFLIRVFDSTVINGKSIPKVALYEIKLHLRDTSKGADLSMRDSYYDMLDEINSQEAVNPNHWQVWESPDLWNRIVKDSSRVPENAEYFNRITDSNYLYVRVRNVGCAASVADVPRLKLYWTLAATGEWWPRCWRDTTTFCSISGGRAQAAGVITNSGGIPIPRLAPGDTFIVATGWKPTKPDTFCNFPATRTLDVCVLARIEESNKPQLGMHKVELQWVSGNVRENNNIVTRNLEIVSLGRAVGMANPSGHTLLVSSGHTDAVRVSLQMLTDRDINRHFAGDLSQYMTVTLKLGDLFNRWVEGGGNGKYAAINTTERTVTYDAWTPLRLDNVLLNPNDVFPVEVIFALKDSAVLNFPVIDRRMYFRQMISDSSGKEVADGAVAYAISIDTTDGGGGSPRKGSLAGTGTSGGDYTIYPNPATSLLSIAYSGAKATVADVSVTDIVGRRVLVKQGLSMQAGTPYTLGIDGLTPGVYFLKIGDSRQQSVTFKVMKE